MFKFFLGVLFRSGPWKIRSGPFRSIPGNNSFQSAQNMSVHSKTQQIIPYRSLHIPVIKLWAFSPLENTATSEFHPVTKRL